MTQRELTPADYLAMLRRRWVLIAACGTVWGCQFEDKEHEPMRGRVKAVERLWPIRKNKKRS